LTLAHREGEAWGTEAHYTGSFRKGFPNGKGRYKYTGAAFYP